MQYYWCLLKTISSCTLVPDKVILVDPWWSPANEIDHHQLDLHCIEPVDPGLNLVIPSFNRRGSYVIYLHVAWITSTFLSYKGYRLTLFILLRAILILRLVFCVLLYITYSRRSRPSVGGCPSALSLAVFELEWISLKKYQ